MHTITSDWLFHTSYIFTAQFQSSKYMKIEFCLAVTECSIVNFKNSKFLEMNAQKLLHMM